MPTDIDIVLVVESDTRIQEVISTSLEGMIVFTSSSLFEAERLLKELFIDVIVIDISSLNFDQESVFCKEQLARGVKIVVLTTHKQNPFPAAGYLRKPFSTSDLRRMVLG